MTDARTVVRPVRAPRLEVELARSRLAARLYGIATQAPKIAHYEIIERIGFGAQGDVYLVHDPRLQRRLAIKVLRREVGREGIAEARALAQIVHPNVVPVFDVGVMTSAADEHSHAYIVMEYVAGRSLQAWCEGGDRWVDRLRVLVDAGRGLQAAHAVGIVHGDFKPSNIVVGDDRRPRVMDFGLARWGSETSTPSESDTDRTGGTPGYRAPECDAQRADAKSDQYSFCATCWRLLVELPAASPGGRRELARVRSILQRGLQARPEDRWPELGRLLDRLARASARRRVFVPVAIAAGVGALAWSSLALSSMPNPRRHDDASATRGLDAGRLEARLLLHLGLAEWGMDRLDEAQAAFERAVHLASERGDERASAEAAVRLVDLFGRRRSMFGEARRWEPHARAAIARLGDRDLAADLDFRWGTILGLAGQTDPGRELLLDLRERLIADPSLTTVSVVDVESSLARLETQAGRSTEALRWAESAVEGQAARVGTEHIEYARALVRLGVAQEQRADLANARATLERAFAIFQREGDEASMFGVHNSLAIVLERQRDFVGAAREYDLALQWATEQHADDAIVSLRVNLGALELARRDPESALQHFTIARTLAEGIYPAEHRLFVAIHHGLGVAHGRMDEPERAVPDLERALELAVANGMSTTEIGKHRCVLGQARWTHPQAGARARARAEVEQGRGELDADPDAYGEEIAEADEWLKTHRLAGVSPGP